MGFQDKLKQLHGNAVSINDIDTTGVLGPKGASGPHKPGIYTWEVVDASDNKSKRGNSYISFEMECKGPEFEGRKTFENFTYDAPAYKGNDRTGFEKDNVAKITAICRACGLSEADPMATIGKRFVAATGLEKNEYQGEVRYYPAIWDAFTTSEREATGPYPDDEQPKVWFEALKNENKKESSKSSGGINSSLEDDDIPF